MRLRVFGCDILLRTSEPELRDAVRTVYGALEVLDGGGSAPRLTYDADAGDSGYFLRPEAAEPLVAGHLGEFIYLFEKQTTIALQNCAPISISSRGRAKSPSGGVVAMAGPPGAGKSTTTWALVHNGFSYLSDELAPVDPATLAVEPYPHALLLKDPPPAPYPVAPGTGLLTPWNCHIPTAELPAAIAEQGGTLAALVFVSFDPRRAEPRPGGCGAPRRRPSSMPVP